MVSLLDIWPIIIFLLMKSYNEILIGIVSGLSLMNGLQFYIQFETCSSFKTVQNKERLFSELTDGV